MTCRNCAHYLRFAKPYNYTGECKSPHRGQATYVPPDASCQHWQKREE